MHFVTQRALRFIHFLLWKRLMALRRINRTVNLFAFENEIFRMEFTMNEVVAATRGLTLASEALFTAIATQTVVIALTLGVVWLFF